MRNLSATFASEILNNVCVDEFEGRFWYGELRLGRLNIIYRLRLGIVRGFYMNYHKYGSFFAINFKWVAISFLYITVVLSAMQVALAGMTAIQGSEAQKLLMASSFQFAIFCMFLIIFVLLLLALTFVTLFVWNYLETKAYEREMKAKRTEYKHRALHP